MTAAIHQLAPHAFEINAQGVLDRDDYQRFLPLAEYRIAQQGRINLLVHIADCHGLSPGALWQDLRFDVRHYRDVARLAVVGERPIDALVADLSRLFTAAAVRYFHERDVETARLWVAASA